MYRESKVWGSFDNLNASTKNAVMEAAKCDRAIYEDALRRSSIPPPALLGERVNKSRCRRMELTAPDGTPLLAYLLAGN